MRFARAGLRPFWAALALWAMLMPPHMATQCSEVIRPSTSSMPRLMPARATGNALIQSATTVRVMTQ